MSRLRSSAHALALILDTAAEHELPEPSWFSHAGSLCIALRSHEDLVAWARWAEASLKEHTAPDGRVYREAEGEVLEQPVRLVHVSPTAVQAVAS